MPVFLALDYEKQPIFVDRPFMMSLILLIIMLKFLARLEC